MKYLWISIISLISTQLMSQDTDRKIEFPDVEGFRTLICDFHIHTVFSDGLVWPTIRVDEAVKDGLDAIALTEHIEYQPHKTDIPHPDRNRSFEIARKAAKPHDLLVIHGTEITRSMPPGHANALFVTDVNEIIVEDAMESYRKARAQGAFIFWNHPNWINQQKDGIPVITDFHKQLISEDLLHGMEVVNDITFSEYGLQVAQEYGLTLMGTSDIHGLVDYQFALAEGGHRPVNLVLAKEKSEEAIKEALFAGRTITWFDNILAGKEENLRMLIDSCLLFTNKDYIGDSEVLEIEIKNVSDAKLILQNTSGYDFYRNSDVIEVLPHSTKVMSVLTVQDPGKPLSFKVLNALIGYKQQLEISYGW